MRIVVLSVVAQHTHTRKHTDPPSRYIHTVLLKYYTTMKLTFFKKIKKTDPVMGEKLNFIDTFTKYVF
jgi:hypothetical protein